MTQIFDEMHRRQKAIARRRNGGKNQSNRKFSLLLGKINVPSSKYGSKDHASRGSRMKYVLLIFGKRVYIGMWVCFCCIKIVCAHLNLFVICILFYFTPLILCPMSTTAPLLLILYIVYGRERQQQKVLTEKIDRGSVRNKYWKANVVQHQDEESELKFKEEVKQKQQQQQTEEQEGEDKEEEVGEDETADEDDKDEEVENKEPKEDTEQHLRGDSNTQKEGEDDKDQQQQPEAPKEEDIDNKKTGDDKNLAKIAQSSRPFFYIGDYDPAKPKPWPESEVDWWKVHNALVQIVKDSDASPPAPKENNLPQLIFYGDSITEGWWGTSFGNRPGKHRMWQTNEDSEIRTLFSKSFGSESTWGKKAIKQSLVLGISGSRTYDFLWRINNGEFPTAQLLSRADYDKADLELFEVEKLERIYIVLMGTNNLGGGMLPEPTIKGMDAVGRRILELHREKFPNTPMGMLFSELLPRHDDFRAEKMCPPRCANDTTKEPYKSFMPAIEKVNKALPEVVDGWRKDYENSRIVLLSSKSDEKQDTKDGDKKEDDDSDLAKDMEYTVTINCGKDMFAYEDLNEFDTYMPDRLHPNAKGYESWSKCIKRGLEVVMDDTVSLLEEKK